MFDDVHVFDSDGILALHQIPRSMVIVGAGVIGIEYASIFAALGTKVTVIEQRDRMLEFCDEEIVEALQFHLRSLAVTFRFRETVEAVEAHDGATVTLLASGKAVAAEVVMYSAGRQGATDGLCLDAVGITPDKRGRITVDDYYRTNVEHIYAVGDVIGFPALASTSMEQGRLAAFHAFGEPTASMAKTMPIGIYTIPEMSYVGETEAQLTDASVPYEVGISRYRELARGQNLRRFRRDAEAPRFAYRPQDPRRPSFRHRRHRDRPYRPSSYGLRRHGRLLARRCLQLPDVGRGLQSGRPRRDQQAAHRGAAPPLNPGRTYRDSHLPGDTAMRLSSARMPGSNRKPSVTAAPRTPTAISVWRAPRSLRDRSGERVAKR